MLKRVIHSDRDYKTAYCQYNVHLNIYANTVHTGLAAYVCSLK